MKTADTHWMDAWLTGVLYEQFIVLLDTIEFFDQILLAPIQLDNFTAVRIEKKFVGLF